MSEHAKTLLIERARSRVGASIYRGRATVIEAPLVFNCFRFTQWVWHGVGIQLPDHQLQYPYALTVAPDDVAVADLIFIPRLEYDINTDDFGHVGIMTESSTIVHATKWRNGVVEDPLSDFIGRGILGIRRIPERLYCR